jgi:integrase
MSTTSNKRYRSFGSVAQKGANKFQASYKHEGKTYYGPRRFPTRTDANNWLAIEQALIAKGTWTDPKVPDPVNTATPDFKTFALKHIELQTTAAGAQLKPSTRAKYKSYVNAGLARIADTPIDKISKSLVDQLWIKWIAGGRLTTASKHYKLLHAVMERARKDGWLGENASNPCQVRGAQNASTKRVLRTPSMEEVVTLANVINPRFSLLTLLAAFTGLRFGEITALRRKHFSRQGERYVIDVVGAVTFVERQFVLDKPKSASGIRTKLVSSKLTTLIDTYLSTLRNDPDALVFASAGGVYLRNDVLNKAMNSAAKRAGLDPRGFSPHSLRRAGATEYANRGANIAEVQEYLGDSSAAAALRYINTTNRSVELVERIGEGIWNQ